MTSESRYLEVAVPTPLRRTFHYLPPPGADRPAPGARVRVPFGNRKNVVGVLLDTRGTSNVDPGKIRPAVEILDEQAVFPNALMTLCTWAADYYHHPVGEVFATALPRLLRQGEPTSGSIRLLAATGRQPGSGLDRAPRQAALFGELRNAHEGLSGPELKRLQMSATVIQGLIDKQLASWRLKDDMAAPFDPGDVRVNRSGITLNEEQIEAVDAIRGPGTWLLYGITGSGKTEVYLRLIEKFLAAGKQALVLVPEIGLTPQTLARFTRRFSVKVVAMHSALTDRERLEAWRHAAGGVAGIVIGTRSAIFTPLKNPGLIVVDEEHDTSFKQQEGFRYSARDLAVMRGHLEGLPVLLGSATPSLETLYNVVRDKYRQLTLSHRAGDARPARYRIIDIRNRKLEEGFSGELVELIKQQLDAGNQVLIFLNRRGFAPVLLCHECGWIAKCHRCDARLTWHQAQKALICHHCGGINRIPENCPDCQSRQLLALGVGTERVEQTLSRMLPNRKIVRIDRDTTRRKDYMSNVVRDLRRGEPAVLVGTQLLAKGHHFPDVTLAAILDMDSGFYSADFKAVERMGQLIMQVGGRSGRATKPGLIAIQTHFPEADILQTLMHEGYPTFAEKLLAERRENELPPWRFLTLVRAEATSRSLPMKFLTETADRLNTGNMVELLGPVPSPMEKRAGKFRAQLLMSSEDRNALQRTVKDYIAVAEDSPLARKIRWSVDVDPVDLF